MDDRDFTPNEFAYQAFISYSRSDTEFVDDLFSRLQKFRTPKPLLKQQGEFGSPLRRLRVYLDRRSAQAGATVSDRLLKAIHSSAFLIVVCSPHSRASKWVNLEVDAFLEHASPDRILPVFLKNDRTQPIEEIMPEGLLKLGDNCPIGADLLIDGGEESVSQKLLGAMLGVPQDRVAREQERADKRRSTLERVALSTISVLAIAAAAAGWSAFDQADKAKETLKITLNALDKTTPFANRMVAEGRIKLEDVAPWKAELDAVFASFERQSLRSLPDVRYSLGQVMLQSAFLSASMGETDRQLDSANRAHDLLLPFRDDPGPVPQLLICDALLQRAWIGLRVEDFDMAKAATSECDMLLSLEIRANPIDQDLLQILYKRLQSRLTVVEIELAQENFSAASATIESDIIEDQIADLEQVEPDHALFMAAQLLAARATIFERMGRYADALDHYTIANEQLTSLQPDPLSRVNLLSGMARVQSELSGGSGEAVRNVDLLIEATVAAIDQDSAQRQLRALHAGFLTMKADLLMVQSDAQDGGFERQAVEVEQAYTEAIALSEDLVTFDPENKAWQRSLAFRLSDLGEFYFRLHETSGHNAPVCGANCLIQAEEALVQAHAILDAEESPSPSLERTRIDMELSIGRVLRFANRSDAGAWVEKAEQNLARIDQAQNPRAVSLLSARVLDEKADLLAVDGQSGEAIALLNQALELHRAAMMEEPSAVRHSRNVLWTYRKMLEVYVDTPVPDAEQAALEAACLVIAETPLQQSSWLMRRDAAWVRSQAEDRELECAQT